MTIDLRRRTNRHAIYLRIVALIDVLAPVRFGLTTEEVTRQLNAKTGHTYSTRTIHRDLTALSAIGYVDRRRGVQTGKRGNAPLIWRLNLSATHNIQTVAYKTLPA